MTEGDSDALVLAARGISKAYGVVQALAEVDFEVRASEIVGLAGENGSGKSTLAKILAGAVTPDAGSIEVSGTARSFQRPRDALDAGVALVAQEPTAVPELSVAENVLLTHLPGTALQLFRLRTYVRRARETLEVVGVRADPTAPLASLRAGDRELVEVAKAIATRPRVLILDEATSRFGEADVLRLFAILRRLREDGTSTVLITHRLSEIGEICDRAIVLRDGHRVGQVPREGLQAERIAAMMVGRELKAFFHKRKVVPGEVVLRVEGLVVDGTSQPVSLDVRGGEIVALAGLVGSGRSELLEAIYGARRSRAGTVTVDGRAVRRNALRAALRAGIALIPEDRHKQGLNLQATVRDNILMGSWRLLATEPRRERRLSLEAVERLRIRTAGLDASIRSLSGGNQQKVVVARCLGRRPRVLLLDEPTRGIDVGAKEEFFQLIGSMLADGMAILLVASELLEVLGLADRVLVMHERRIVGELGRETATEERIAYLAAGGEAARVA